MAAIRNRWLGALCLMFALAGCASFHPFQDPSDAIIRIGSFDSASHGPVKAETVAGYFVPYALLSTYAYGDDKVGGARWEQLLSAVDAKDRPLKSKILAWFDEWLPLQHKDYAEGYLPCSDKRIAEGRCRGQVDGMAYQIWVRKTCSEVVVAFRGTNFSEVNDWISNFHWFTRLLPLYDQYEQVQDNALPIAELMQQHCRGRKSVQLTAIGHSLGGGLAQQMAYSTTTITKVVAFDPSMVTGYYDVDSTARNRDDRLEVDRVYEHGEILAYFRYFMRQFAPPTACRPQIRNIRFDLLHGNVIEQHSVSGIAAKLVELAGTPEQWRARKDKYVLPRGRDIEPVKCAPATM